MYSRNTQRRNYFTDTGMPPPHYGGTAVSAASGKKTQSEIHRDENVRSAAFETKTRIHSPDGSERLSGRRPIDPDPGGTDGGMRPPKPPLPPFTPESGEDKFPNISGVPPVPPKRPLPPPEPARPDRPDKPKPERPCLPGENCDRTDDILLAALIALLFGNRCDDELLLMLVLLYITGM